MKLWTAFNPLILVYVPGCAQPAVDQALLLASMDFFQQSLAWRRWLDPVNTIEGVTEYDLDVDNGQEVVQLRGAKLDGEDLPVVLPDAYRPPRTRACQRIYTRDRLTFGLTVAPGAAPGVIEAQVVLKPSLTATGLPDDVFGKHAQSIAKGAAAALMQMPGQSFNNPALSMDFRGQFNAAITAAGLDADSSFSKVLYRTRLAPI